MWLWWSWRRRMTVTILVQASGRWRRWRTASYPATRVWSLSREPNITPSPPCYCDHSFLTPCRSLFSKHAGSCAHTHLKHPWVTYGIVIMLCVCVQVRSELPGRHRLRWRLRQVAHSGAWTGPGQSQHLWTDYIIRYILGQGSSLKISLQGISQRKRHPVQKVSIYKANSLNYIKMARFPLHNSWGVANASHAGRAHALFSRVMFLLTKSLRILVLFQSKYCTTILVSF